MEHHTSKCSLFLALTNKEDWVSARWNNRKLTFKQWCKKNKKINNISASNHGLVHSLVSIKQVPRKQASVFHYELSPLSPIDVKEVQAIFFCSSTWLIKKMVYIFLSCCLFMGKKSCL